MANKKKLLAYRDANGDVLLSNVQLEQYQIVWWLPKGYKPQQGEFIIKAEDVGLTNDSFQELSFKTSPMEVVLNLKKQ